MFSLWSAVLAPCSHGRRRFVTPAGAASDTNPKRQRGSVGALTPSLAHRAGMLLLLALLLSGCRHAKEEKKPAAGPPVVQVVKPTRRTIDCTVQQPGFVNAYEQTSLFSKVSGFIGAYYADIGDEVKEGQPLADILAPELVAEHEQMVRQAELDKQLVVVAEKNVENAVAGVAEAKANVGKFEAEVARWQTEVGRLTEMLKENVVDKEILTETQRQLASSTAAKNAALASVNAREADLHMAEANQAKASIQVKVAEAEERKSAAMVAYLR